jgi:hypothetical protein
VKLWFMVWFVNMRGNPRDVFNVVISNVNFQYVTVHSICSSVSQ